MRDRSRGRLVLVTTLAVLAFGLEGLSQNQSPAPDPSSTPPAAANGLLAGRVVDALTGKPVAGVSISVGGGPGGSFSYSVGPGGQPLINGPGRPQLAGGAPRQVLTDSEGRFLFYNLSKGNYVLRTTGPPGYVNGGGYGQNRPAGPVQPVTLAADDSKVGDLTIRVWKTAVIAGIVTDEAGEPAVGILVSVLRRTTVKGQPRNVYSSSASTDDRGMYRVSTLIPGEYVVGIISSQSTMPVSVADTYAAAVSTPGGTANSPLYQSLMSSGIFPTTSGYRVGDQIVSAANGRSGGSAPAPVQGGKLLVYPTTFYQSAGSASQGTLLKLAAGEERTGVDFQLRLVPGVRVSGTVTGPDGAMANTGVRLVSADVSPVGPGVIVGDSATSITDGSGAFTFLGVTPGPYTLSVVRVPRPPPSPGPPSGMTTIEVSGPGGQMMGIGMISGGPGTVPPIPQQIPADPTLSATLPVTVGDTDISGLTVALHPGAHLSGRLVFDGTHGPPTAEQLQRTFISITAMEMRPGMNPQVRVDASGNFTTGGFSPGRYQIGTGINVPTWQGLPPTVNWTLKSATANGRNLADEPLDIADEDVTGIVLTYTDRVTQITGAVIGSQGAPDKTAEVVVAPADSQSWKEGLPSTRRLRSARASSIGVYEFSGLPPGDYVVAAFGSDTTVDLQDQKFIESVIGIGTRVTLADGETKTQDLTVKSVR